MPLILGLLALAVAAVGAAARYRAPVQGWEIGITAFSPYLLLGAPLAAVLLLVSRHWWVAGVAVLATVGCLGVQLPLFVASTASRDAPTFVAMTANLRLGQAHAAAVVAAVQRHHVDALMLQELTAAEQEQLIAAGLDRVLPFHASEPRDYAYGTGLWSRYALSGISRRHDFTCSFITADATVPGLDEAITLAAVHMAGPWPKSVHWQYDMATHAAGPGRAHGAQAYRPDWGRLQRDAGCCTVPPPTHRRLPRRG